MLAAEMKSLRFRAKGRLGHLRCICISFRKVLSVDSAGYCAEGLTYTHESIRPTKVREMVLYHV